MSDPVITIHIGDDDYRRWVAMAGRKGKAVEAWVYEVIAHVIKAEVPGKINPVLREDAGTPPSPVVRYCGFCGKPLPSLATARRRYCGDRCRVAAWRQDRRA